MSDPTLTVYEQRADDWEARRAPKTTGDARRFGADARRSHGEARIVDLGCGPGWYTRDLGPGPVIAVDGARAMLDLVPRYAPGTPRVQADLRSLPFRRGAFDAAWASKSYVHLPRSEVPLALADLHRTMADDAMGEIVVFGGDMEHGQFADDAFAGRRFSQWPPDRLHDVLRGAGFEVASFRTEQGSHASEQRFRVRVRRERTLPDYVAADLQLLLVGLNPSVYSADRGVGFARPGNRFWPAALGAGIVTRDRDPWHTVRVHGIGMTDMVKRATARADELDPTEYREGFQRLSRLVAWSRPRVVCIIGLSGWRVAVDRKAVAGVQPEPLEGAPVYVMPNTSGLNARTPLLALTEHLRAASALAG